MSGIVGIVNLDGAPVDAGLLARMTQFLKPRGPDAQRTWIENSVGFGHALLSIDSRLVQYPQPCTLDGRVWITADARLDARDELLDKLPRRSSAEAQDLRRRQDGMLQWIARDFELNNIFGPHYNNRRAISVLRAYKSQRRIAINE